MKKQTFHRNGCIIYGLFRFSAHGVAHFTAISVYTVTYSVQKSICISAETYLRQIVQIFVYANGTILTFCSDIMQKIVSATRSIIINAVSLGVAIGFVYKSVQRAVAACDYHGSIFIELIEKIAVIFYFGDIMESKAVMRKKVFQLRRTFFLR